MWLAVSRALSDSRTASAAPVSGRAWLSRSSLGGNQRQPHSIRSWWTAPLAFKHPPRRRSTSPEAAGRFGHMVKRARIWWWPDR
jgi:hypothetical protein